MYYEIDYDASPYPGVGKFVKKPEKIVPPEKDEIRELFTRMRDIARSHRSRYDYSMFFDRRVQYDNAAIFYEQGMFMKDFTDSYESAVPFSQYFPSYQMMGYAQLRTYFTWRGETRKGNVADTSLSYAFLYIYELLANIGVSDPVEGLDKLMAFRKAFGAHNSTIDRYIIRWLKDYHIYYELPRSFKKFTEENSLTGYYSKTVEKDDDFGLFCEISRYDIRKSAFFTEKRSRMISDCFLFVIERIRRDFEAAGMNFDDSLFRPTKKVMTWRPFPDAVFHPWLTQRDRRVIISEREIYTCKNNEWTTSTVVTSEKGRQFIGYVMKQMEASLREASKYKFKLSADTGMVNEDTLKRLTKAELFIDKIVAGAVAEFYRDATKTVVKVDFSSLDRIRRESMATQESLIVEEDSARDQNIFGDPQDAEPVLAPNDWKSLGGILSDGELQALSAILRGGSIKAFADECGIMLEVLADGINEKAMDYIGDNLIDEEFSIYDDYKERVKELIG